MIIERSITMALKVIHTDKAPKAVGPYSQAIKAGNFLFCSGQIPLDPETGKIVDGCVMCQTKQALMNAKAVLEEAGYALTDVAKVIVYLKNMGDFASVNEVYAEFFGEHKPARCAFQVAALPLDAMVEIEFTAYKE